MEWTGSTRKYAIKLLNHGEQGQKTILCHRLPQYLPAVQQAHFSGRQHNICVPNDSCLPSLPSLVMLLEQHGQLCLMEEERCKLLAMSLFVFPV